MRRNGGAARPIVAGSRPKALAAPIDVFQDSPPNTTTGACPSGSQPAFRVFDARPGANHRCTTSLAIRAQVEMAGLVREGGGPDATIVCAIGPTNRRLASGSRHRAAV
ncbi:hypothetical protein BURK1_00389 [Burkholderiales bacterium]|nr:hypothetical protein BURK1_00389 [Burkholderiales bacterium]